MPRYFLEVAYKGTNYAGFQIQQNALTIQEEIEKAFLIFFNEKVDLTGSSRTDAGVHSLQNFFHFDFHLPISTKILYNLNSIIPVDIVLKNIYEVKEDAHSRFLADAREYEYFIYQSKNPFLQDRAWFYPFPLDIVKLNEAAKALMNYQNFTSFSKKNTQVNNFICTIYTSQWTQKNDSLVYTVKANRFLRGMVKALVGTMMQVGKGNISLDKFCEIIESQNCNLANFTPPSHGLFLVNVFYPEDVLKNKL